MLDWLPWVRARRDRLFNTPLSDEQRTALHENVPAVSTLDAAEQERLEGLIQLFLYDKSFEGLQGLEITDAIRVTIAGQACMLLLGLDVEWPYRGLDVIRVYPNTYRAQGTHHDGNVTHRLDHHRAGESSSRGYVVLSWTSALRGGRAPHDGHNVVFHEFAHQLDQASGHANGAPILHRSEHYGPWARVLQEAFGELRRDVRRRRKNVLDAYGATNEAEFFAVATEAFFERPRSLQAAEPELYEVLATYFRQDPASRRDRREGR